MPFLRIMIAGFLALMLMALFACGPGDTGKNEPAESKTTLIESFESAQDVSANGAYLLGEGNDAFIAGFNQKGYWLGDGNKLIYQANKVVHPEHGAIEFWICPKSNWHDGSLRHILTVGSPEGFSITKAPDSGTLRLTLHGKSIDFFEMDLFVGPTYKHQWRSGWNHVAVTWRNLGYGTGGELVLMVNGEVRNQLVGKLPRIDNHDPLIIGEVESGHAAKAIIDDLVIYNYHKPYYDFSNATASYQLDPREKIMVYPTPHPVGLLFGEGFSVTPETAIVVGDSVYESMIPALEQLNAVLNENLGYELAIVQAGQFDSAENFIAIGTESNNEFLEIVAGQGKILADENDPGSGGYILEVMNKGIVVAGADYLGSIKGLFTLLQMFRQHTTGKIPPYLMVDFPDMPFRGTVVRGGELLTNELRQRLLYFASLGLSHVVFDTEAYFDLNDETIRGRLTDTFSFARNLGLEPVPLINSFSKSSKIIELCAEAGVDCSENGSEHTYCPAEPYVYTVLTKAINNVITYLQPEYIHIGHDDIRAFNKDPRSIEANLSPGEWYIQDITRIIDIIKAKDMGVEVLIWWDMLNPMHYLSTLQQPAPGDDPPDPPDVSAMAPRDVIWCPYFDASIDATLQFVYPMLTMMELSAGLWGTFTGGPARADMEGAYSWIRHGIEFSAIGFLHRPFTTDGLESENWHALPVAAEFAWSYYTPFDPAAVWWDYIQTNENYGGMVQF